MHRVPVHGPADGWYSDRLSHPEGRLPELVIADVDQESQIGVLPGFPVVAKQVMLSPNDVCLQRRIHDDFPDLEHHLVGV